MGARAHTWAREREPQRAICTAKYVTHPRASAFPFYPITLLIRPLPLLPTLLPLTARAPTHPSCALSYIYIPTHVLSLAPLLARGSPVQFTLSLRPGALAGPCSHSAPPRAPRPAPRLFSGHGEKKEREREKKGKRGECARGIESGGGGGGGGSIPKWSLSGSRTGSEGGGHAEARHTRAYIYICPRVNSLILLLSYIPPSGHQLCARYRARALSLPRSSIVRIDRRQALGIVNVSVILGNHRGKLKWVCPVREIGESAIGAAISETCVYRKKPNGSVGAPRDSQRNVQLNTATRQPSVLAVSLARERWDSPLSRSLFLSCERLNGRAVTALGVQRRWTARGSRERDGARSRRFRSSVYYIADTGKSLVRYCVYIRVRCYVHEERERERFWICRGDLDAELETVRIPVGSCCSFLRDPLERESAGRIMAV